MPEAIATQIEKELGLIRDLQYEAYFLTVYDIVQYARGQGILCQGRGSANSAVCYCLGITEVDPIRGHALFERFISKERNEPPDIDVDFEHQRREEVIQYIYDKYGRDRALTAVVISIGRAAAARHRPRAGRGQRRDRRGGARAPVVGWQEGNAAHAGRLRAGRTRAWRGNGPGWRRR